MFVRNMIYLIRNSIELKSSIFKSHLVLRGKRTDSILKKGHRTKSCIRICVQFSYQMVICPMRLVYIIIQFCFGAYILLKRRFYVLNIHTLIISPVVNVNITYVDHTPQVYAPCCCVKTFSTDRTIASSSTVSV